MVIVSAKIWIDPGCGIGYGRRAGTGRDDGIKDVDHVAEGGEVDVDDEASGGLHVEGLDLTLAADL